MAVSTTYLSFLVRLWCEGHPQQAGLSRDWCGEAEHIQSGRRWTFNDVEDLLSFLRGQTEAAQEKEVFSARSSDTYM